jgi:hypothetical protein
MLLPKICLYAEANDDASPPRFSHTSAKHRCVPRRTVETVFAIVTTRRRLRHTRNVALKRDREV